MTTFIKKHKESIIISLLWILMWAGYNTTIERVFAPGFPHNTLDFIHGMRAFIPLVVGLIIVALFFFKKERLKEHFLLTPLGLLLLYSLVGIISSLLSRYPLFALYWAVMYGTVALLVAFIARQKDSLNRISLIIKINWVIALVVALILLAFFLMQPGVLSSLNFHSLFFNQRPYEAIGNVQAGTVTFGMAGTRPTGFARYAAIAALILFWRFLNSTKNHIGWLLAFLFFFAILIFSRGRTELVAFIPAVCFLFWSAKKFRITAVLFFIVILAITGITVFNNIHSPGSTSQFEDAYTLSGRTNGVWADAINLFYKSPLLGYGFQADRYFLGGQHAHNTLLHALVQTGLVGTLFLFAAFIGIGYMIYRLIKDRSSGLYHHLFSIEVLGVFIFLFVRGITESVAFYSADWLFLAPIVAYIQTLYLENRQS